MRTAFEKLDWNQDEPDASRYARVSDGIETYYAALPAGMTLDEATDDFATGYDHNRQPGTVRCTGSIIEDGEEIESIRFEIESPAWYNVTFRKQFNEFGEGIDFPADFLHVPEGVINNAHFVTMRAPTAGVEYGEEEWRYEVNDPAVFENATAACSTVVHFERVQSEGR